MPSAAPSADSPDLPRRPGPQSVTIAGLAADRYQPVAPEEGPPIVYVHGAMDRAAGFRRTARHLPHRSIVAYDRRGYAASVALDPAPTLAAGADDLIAVAAELAESDGRPRLLVGHSMGALIVLHALGRPGIADVAVGAVIWESPMPWQPWYRTRGDGLVDLAPERAAEAFLRAMIGDRLWERLPESMKAARRAEGEALVADLRGARRPDAAVDLARITLPVVVGGGALSGDHHRRSVATIAEALGSEAVTVEDADHGVHLSRPAAFASLIDAWPGPAGNHQRSGESDAGGDKTPRI